MSTKLFDITKQLGDFLASPANSGSLKETNGLPGIYIIQAHVQKRWLTENENVMAAFADTVDNEKVNCLNIVTVSVAEKNRRKGVFTDFLQLIEEFDYGSYLDKCSSFYIRVHNVMNPVLDAFLLKNGYSQTKADNETDYSYHKKVMIMNATGKKPADQSAVTPAGLDNSKKTQRMSILPPQKGGNTMGTDVSAHGYSGSLHSTQIQT